MIRRKISTRLLIKGALIEETYAAFKSWNLDKSTKTNLENIRKNNLIGAKNEKWLNEIIRTLSSRFTDTMDFTPLVILAQGGFIIDKWKPCLLCHIGFTDELYYRFATEWLFDQYKNGAIMLRTDNVIPFAMEITEGRIASGKKLSEYGTKRVAQDLLRMAAAFGLLSGRTKRQFESYAEHEPNAYRIIHSPYWKLFLMSPGDVEGELFRLHQYRKLEYEVAGTLAHLKLPYRILVDYAKEIVS